MTFTTRFDAVHNVITLNGVPVSLHCHHYNCGLLRVIEDIPGVDARKILIKTAAEEFFDNFSTYLADQKPDCTEVEALQKASDLYRTMGFGRIDLSGLGKDGGTAFSDSSYYVVGWLAKYGRRQNSICYVTCGFVAGVLAAVFRLPPDAYEVQENSCIAAGGESCIFSISRR